MNEIQSSRLSEWLATNLVCPRDRSRITQDNRTMVCESGHHYWVVDGIPVMLRDDVPQTHGEARASLDVAKYPDAAARLGMQPFSNEMNPHVQKLVAATSGHLYKPLLGKLPRYPIPELRLPDGVGRRFLDIGCNWGRWMIAAARMNYKVVGVDPSLGALLVARQVFAQLGLNADFVVADARYLPFRDSVFGTVFSYSVLQHFSKKDALESLCEIGRVMAQPGECLVQMANKFGIRSGWHQLRRGFREPKGFEVRYWSPSQLSEAFRATIGDSALSVDCFFGLGVQAADADLLPTRFRAVVRASEVFRRLTDRFRFLRLFADSVYLHVVR